MLNHGTAMQTTHIGQGWQVATKIGPERMIRDVWMWLASKFGNINLIT